MKMKKNTVKTKRMRDRWFVTYGPLFGAIGVGESVEESFNDMLRTLNSRRCFLRDTGDQAHKKDIKHIEKFLDEWSV